MGLVRRILLFTLVLTLSLIGIPLPAHAASSEETLPLMFNGRLLSDLLYGRAPGAPFPLPALRQQDDGQISGVVTIPSGTRLEVVLDQQLSARTARVGDTFPLSLAESVVIDNQRVLAAGTSLAGQIVDVSRGGANDGNARLTLVLHRLLPQGGGAIPTQSEPLMLERGLKVKDVTIMSAIVGVTYLAVYRASRHWKSFEGGGYLFLGGSLGGGAAYAHFANRLVLASGATLVFRLSGDVTIEMDRSI